MTQDEKRMLSELAGKIAKTPAPPKDPEAEEFIRKQIGSRPDALYLMTQTVLIQNMALQQAQQQIQELQRRAGQSNPVGGGSFLGGSRPGGYAPSQPQYSSPQYSQQLPNAGGAPSFLRGAAQTAAGVAAGALAFEGIRSLFSHPGYGGEHGFGDYGGFGGYPGGETIVNNYYEGEPGSAAGAFGGNDDLQLHDNRDALTGENFDAGNSGDLSGSDTNDAAFDNSGFDDGGGFDDDGGGFDDNFA